VDEHKPTGQLLQISREVLDGLILSAMDAIIAVDEHQQILLFNPAAEKMFGYHAAEIMGQPLNLLLPERYRASHPEQVRSFGQNGVTTRKMGALGNVSGRRKNSEEFPLEVSISHLMANGKSIYTAILRDVTERKQDELKIRRFNRVYAVLSQIDSLIVRAHSRQELFAEATRIATEAGHFIRAWIVLVNGGGTRLELSSVSGTDASYFEKIKLSIDTLPDDIRTRLMEPMLAKQPLIINDLQNESWLPLKDEALACGSRSMVWLPLVAGDRITSVLVLHADMPDFFNAEEMKLLLELAGDIGFAINHIEKSDRLNYLAHYDALTGLANSTLFRERVAQYLKINPSKQHVALTLLDVERFKAINDALGRQIGDALLKQVAERLIECAGSSDYVARLSADHFALIIPAVTDEREVAHILEERSHKCFGQAFMTNGIELQVGVKVGVALYPEDGTYTDVLFSNAEAALKKAKAGGEPYLFYSAAMNNRVTGQLDLENKLRKALQQEEFVLYYQPKIACQTRHIVGVEALIRWNAPGIGLVSPTEFIPLLEETGLIVEVGAWALRQAVRDYSRWLDKGLVPPRIAVNVSAIQLHQNDFVEIVKQATADGASPPGIDIEITESLIMEDTEGNIRKLNAIRDMGLSIAIDDFGTGYSSLAYLAQLPVQTLKIDRSFIITMLDDPNTMTLVSTIITLAHSLGMKVVAEGVDKEEQAKILQLIRCDEIQGYLFSKPVPFEEICTLLQLDAKTRPH